MKTICISSDVQNDYMIVGIDDIPYLKNGGLVTLNEVKPFLQLRETYLTDLQTEIDKVIIGLLPSATSNVNGNTEVSYRGHIYKLDFRDERGFSVCANINFYDLVAKAIEKDGCIYIFRRDIVQKYKSGEILAYLRLKQGLMKDRLLENMNAMWQQSKNNKDQVIDSKTLQLGLSYLESFGMISYDQKSKEYQITARGYLYR